jgi:excisionase family DNA binding protein
MQTAVKDYKDLPLTLKVEQVAKILGISRKLAYSLAKRRDFPVVRIGQKRLVVPRDRFLRWLNEKADKLID